jgi:hypothetical protein
LVIPHFGGSGCADRSHCCGAQSARRRTHRRRHRTLAVETVEPGGRFIAFSVHASDSEVVCAARRLLDALDAVVPLHPATEEKLLSQVEDLPTCLTRDVMH